MPAAYDDLSPQAYYNTWIVSQLPYLGLNRRQRLPLDPRYHFCTRCQCHVRTEGHEERCRPTSRAPPRPAHLERPLTHQPPPPSLNRSSGSNRSRQANSTGPSPRRSSVPQTHSSTNLQRVDLSMTTRTSSSGQLIVSLTSTDTQRRSGNTRTSWRMPSTSTPPRGTPRRGS